MLRTLPARLHPSNELIIVLSWKYRRGSNGRICRRSNHIRSERNANKGNRSKHIVLQN